MLLRMPYLKQLQDTKSLSRRERKLNKSTIARDNINEDQRIFPKISPEENVASMFLQTPSIF